MNTFDNTAAAPGRAGMLCTADILSSAGKEYDLIRISPDGELSVIDTSGFDAGGHHVDSYLRRRDAVPVRLTTGMRGKSSFTTTK